MATERGFGIRAPDASYVYACMILNGKTPMEIDGKTLDVSGLPMSWSGENLEEAASNGWNWGISIVRARKQGRTRTWYVRAQGGPQK